MKSSSPSKPKYNYYLTAALIMFLGLIYNLIEQDIIGSAVFLISSIVFISLSLMNKKHNKKENTAV